VLVEAAPLIETFFAAIENRDTEALDRLYADDVRVWHDVTGRSMSKSESLALLDFWTGAVGNMHYEVLERRNLEGGVMQRHVVHGEVGGEPLRAEVCIVFHVEDEQITHIFEYLDQSAVATAFERGG
jgi:ketosteroid isomerase-like protein